ncbi:hypothetical protein [Roseobacter sp.]|uniref:DUF6931 family protein n=1 Tax=Roseobacter sp. TaxID=1907202 RepID=UPI003297B0C6
MHTMSFDDLGKLPQGPVARILSQNNVRLQTTLTTPAGAPAARVLEALHSQHATLDMLQLLAHALPAREATWWACLAAREMGAVTASVTAAEAWVRQPGFESRLAARTALEAVATDDDTGFCAMAACFADGTMGPGALDDHAAPPGAVGAAVYGMVLIAVYADPAQTPTRQLDFLTRGLNIARGGSGQSEP